MQLPEPLKRAYPALHFPAFTPSAASGTEQICFPRLPDTAAVPVALGSAHSPLIAFSDVACCSYLSWRLFFLCGLSVVLQRVPVAPAE